jgi:hypothetical protein
MGAQDPFGKSKTATQHQSEVDEGNIRLAGPISSYEQDVIMPMLNQMVWNNQQFMSYPKVVRQLGAIGLQWQDRTTIAPEDLIGRFLVQPLASHRLLTKQTQVQQLVNILDRAPIINQMYGPQAVKMPKLLAMILEQGFDVRNVDDFISLPTEDGNLLTAMREQELWYHGNVPPVRSDDNQMRHAFAHQEELKEDRFEMLDQNNPQVAAKARAHVAEHMDRIAMIQELQEGMLMQASQQGAMQQSMGGGGGGGGESPVAGAGGPEQEAGSPKVRRNENQRGEGGPKSEAMKNAPNQGAQ